MPKKVIPQIDSPEHRAQRDLAFMRDPNRWPNWPVLPLKNRALRQSHPDQPSFGLLAEGDEPGKPWLFSQGANLYGPHGVYDYLPCTPEDLIANGWEID